MMDYPCAKFGDCTFSRFCFIVQTNTHRQTGTQTRPIAMSSPVVIYTSLNVIDLHGTRGDGGDPSRPNTNAE